MQPLKITLNKHDFSVTSKQMAEVDNQAIQTGIKLADMMEAAGQQLSELTTTLYPIAGKFLVLVGSGHNGGGGLVAARYLKKQGGEVSIYLISNKLKDLTRKQLKRANETRVKVIKELGDLNSFDIVIDAILGYSIVGTVNKKIKGLIEAVNAATVPTISLDLPSGLDPNSGEPHGVAMKADVTLTLAALKQGFLVPEARVFLGEVYLANIGIPSSLIKQVSL